MPKPPPSYTKRQLETLDVLQRNRHANTLFYFLLVVFSGILVGVVYLTISGKGNVTMLLGMLGLDGLIGWSIRQIVAYLYPPICKDEDGNVVRK